MTRRFSAEELLDEAERFSALAAAWDKQLGRGTGNEENETAAMLRQAASDATVLAKLEQWLGSRQAAHTSPLWLEGWAKATAECRDALAALRATTAQE